MALFGLLRQHEENLTDIWVCSTKSLGAICRMTANHTKRMNGLASESHHAALRLSKSTSLSGN
jgi:hypothetical protein